MTQEWNSHCYPGRTKGFLSFSILTYSFILLDVRRESDRDGRRSKYKDIKVNLLKFYLFLGKNSQCLFIFLQTIDTSIVSLCIYFCGNTRRGNTDWCNKIHFTQNKKKKHTHTKKTQKKLKQNKNTWTRKSIQFQIMKLCVHSDNLWIQVLLMTLMYFFFFFFISPNLICLWEKWQAYVNKAKLVSSYLSLFWQKPFLRLIMFDDNFTKKALKIATLEKTKCSDFLKVESLDLLAQKWRNTHIWILY